MVSLPRDILALIGESVSFRDACNLSAASHTMHSVLGSICHQNKQLRDRCIKVQTHEKHPNWPWQVLHVSDFKEPFNDFRIFQWEPVGVHVYIDIQDQNALLRLCQYVSKQYLNPKMVEIYIGRYGQQTPCDSASEADLTDSMLATVAGQASHVTLCRCTSITDMGIQSLHNCTDLCLLDCPLVNMKKSLFQLIFKHSLLSIYENSVGFDELTKAWLHLLHRYGLVHVFFQPKAVFPEGGVPIYIRNILKELYSHNKHKNRNRRPSDQVL